MCACLHAGPFMRGPVLGVAKCLRPCLHPCLHARLHAELGPPDVRACMRSRVRSFVYVYVHVLQSSVRLTSTSCVDHQTQSQTLVVHACVRACTSMCASCRPTKHRDPPSPWHACTTTACHVAKYGRSPFKRAIYRNANVQTPLSMHTSSSHVQEPYHSGHNYIAGALPFGP